MIVSKYSGLNAKISAMMGQLLNYDDYVTLSEQKTVVQVFTKLKELKPSLFNNVFDDISEKDIRRGIIEQKIRITVVNDFKKIYSFIDNFNDKRFLNSFYLKNEIIVLKEILTSIFDERTLTNAISQSALIISKRSKLDLSKLILAKNVDGFIDALKGSKFYDVMSIYIGDKPSLFDLETKLDLYYYTSLWAYQNKYLSKDNKKAIGKINAVEIDITNLIWIYRLKSFYNLSESEIVSHIIPINHLLKKETVMRMVQSKNKDELWQEIKNSPYGFAFDEDISVENSYYNVMDRVYSKTQAQNRDSLATTMRYIYLKENEVSNIVSIIEGIRYGLRKEEIFEYIVLPKRERGK